MTAVCLDPANHQAALSMPPPAEPAKAAIPSIELLGGQSFVPIEHGGAVYWLRTTRAGGLILTK